MTDYNVTLKCGSCGKETHTQFSYKPRIGESGTNWSIGCCGCGDDNWSVAHVDKPW